MFQREYRLVKEAFINHRASNLSQDVYNPRTAVMSRFGNLAFQWLFLKNDKTSDFPDLTNHTNIHIV